MSQCRCMRCITVQMHWYVTASMHTFYQHADALVCHSVDACIASQCRCNFISQCRCMCCIKVQMDCYVSVGACVVSQCRSIVMQQCRYMHCITVSMHALYQSADVLLCHSVDACVASQCRCIVMQVLMHVLITM